MSDVMADLLAKEPETREVEFCMDRLLAQRLGEARYERDRTKREATRKHPDDQAAAEAIAQAEDAEKAYEELLEQVREKLVKFVFVAVEPVVYDKLKAANRPTEQQRTDARKENREPPEWNPDTFYPALLAEACLSVTTPSGTKDGLSVEEAKQLWTAKNWNSAERAELGNAAVAAYLTRTRLDLPPKAG